MIPASLQASGTVLPWLTGTSICRSFPVVVTFVGWTALIKGMICLFLPPDVASEFFLVWGRYGFLTYTRAFHFFSAST
jgi:hypothetical protein